MGMEYGFMGPNYSISTACATANYAFVAAANHLRNGEVDMMIAGGSEAPIIPVGLGGFVACRALSTRNDEPEKASRPWDTNRDGFVMGEGAGMVLSRAALVCHGCGHMNGAEPRSTCLSWVRAQE